MLFAGVPGVTLRGTHFASRVSASLLTACGLLEPVTETLDDCKNLVRNLAGSPEQLNELRARTVRLRVELPLFDTVRFARDLELAYLKMWQRYKNGEAPKRLAVSELY